MRYTTCMVHQAPLGIAQKCNHAEWMYYRASGAGSGLVVVKTLTYNKQVIERALHASFQHIQGHAMFVGIVLSLRK